MQTLLRCRMKIIAGIAGFRTAYLHPSPTFAPCHES
jgi:hypothetical protein